MASQHYKDENSPVKKKKVVKTISEKAESPETKGETLEQ